MRLAWASWRPSTSIPAPGAGASGGRLHAAVEALAADGFRAVVLWVLTANEGARRFYERAGFRSDGAVRTLDFDGTPVEEIRYRRPDSG